MDLPQSFKPFVSEETTAEAIKADLAKRNAPVVTSDQMDLITRTIAADATPDELRLYLYDCARQGVHPLDKLIHFTKRSGKYTPITSIDFMRMRAADTGEYAGSDDAVPGDLEGVPPHPTSMTVTVWRLVQGQRCAFTATARWEEYKPEQAFMWKKMPFTMLGKCAEALALRKGFPRQLAGLYAKEEMDQASEPDKAARRPQPSRGVQPAKDTPGPSVADSAQPPNVAPETIPVPEGYTQVVSYELDQHGWHRAVLSRPAGVEVKTKYDYGLTLKQAFQHQIPAKVKYTEKGYVSKVELYGIQGPGDDFDVAF